MTLSRRVRSGLALLLLGLLGLSLYLYQNFPEILKQQARHALQEFGVDDLEYEGLQLSDSQFKTDKLWLRGTYAGYAYEATFTSLEVHYDWRVLISRKVHSVILSSLDLTLEQTSSNPNSDPTDLYLKDLLPQELIAQLPVKTLQIRKWNMDYRSPTAPLLSASGDLFIAEHLELHLETALAGSDIAVTLRSVENNPALKVAVSSQDNKAEITAVSAQLQQASIARKAAFQRPFYYFL